MVTTDLSCITPLAKRPYPNFNGKGKYSAQLYVEIAMQTVTGQAEEQKQTQATTQRYHIRSGRRR